MDLNKVMLIGNATDNVQVNRIESNNSSVINFVIASNRRYKDNNGDIQQESEYHRCVAYGSSADILGKYLAKGKKLYIEGRLRTRKWTDNEDNVKYSTEVIVTEFIFLDTPDRRE